MKGLAVLENLLLPAAGFAWSLRCSLLPGKQKDGPGRCLCVVCGGGDWP